MIPETEVAEIADINNYLWEGGLTTLAVSNWFDNFSGQSNDIKLERETALSLLKYFTYYGEKELDYLCKAAFSLLKRQAVIQNSQGLFTQEGERQASTFIDNCLFSYIGGAAESGAMLSYHFRQVNMNDIPTRRYVEPAAFLTDISVQQLSSSNLIFMDDFLGTGETVNRFWDTRIAQIRQRCADVKVYWLALIATSEAIEAISNHTNVPVICPQILDESCKAFSTNSTIFPDRTKRETAETVCRHYGEQLVGPLYALGYKNSQVLVGFHHNIPDNTLPVIWADTEIGTKRWQPLFKRKPKVE